MSFAELYARAREQDGRRPGEPLRGHPVEQVLRGAEVRLSDQPHLHAQHHPGQQEVLGQALAGRAEDDPRGASRGARLPAQADARAGREGRRRAQGKGMQFNEIAPAELARCADHEVDRGEILRRIRSRQGQAVQHRARPHPQGQTSATDQAAARARRRWRRIHRRLLLDF